MDSLDPQCETWEPREPAPLLSNARRDAPRTTATAIVDGIPVAVTAADGRRAFVRAEYSQSGAGGGGGGGGGTDAADVSFRGDSVFVDVDMMSPTPLVPEMQQRVDAVRDYLAAALGRDVSVKLDVIPIDILEFQSSTDTHGDEVIDERVLERID